MGETGKEEYKIQSFDAETQQLLKTALKDPSSVDLEKVANIIVDQSLQDCVFSKEAGRICYTIIQVRESLLSGQRNAGSVLRQPLARPRRGFSQPRKNSLKKLQPLPLPAPGRRRLLPFLNNMPRMGLVNPVYDCLFRLAQPDSLRKEEEVDCLVLQLHRIGEQLEKMNSQRMDELFSLLRDGFLLQDGLSSLSQLLLLEIIEFRAADWKMTDAAQKYYYSEVTD
nr:PREDICTED: MIF4G domain-containing protein [Struthio camelus australis]